VKELLQAIRRAGFENAGIIAEREARAGAEPN
jgi:hypothetical protein